jgi:hypothetical protein
MILYILFSFAVGFEAGVFELKGNDIVSSSFGPSFGVFGDLIVTPNLSYSLSFGRGKAGASSQTFGMRIDTIVDPINNDTNIVQPVYSEVQGEDFECFYGNISVDWFPLRTSLSPYLSGRLGLKHWKITSGGDIIQGLGYPDFSGEIIPGNDYQSLSLSIGGGAGLRGKLAGFVVSAEAFSDFIFSEKRDWEEGFGIGDDNEWTLEFIFRLGREF